MKKFIFLIPEYLHKIMKVVCAKDGVAMTNYIVSLIESDLKKRGEI